MVSWLAETTAVVAERAVPAARRKDAACWAARLRSSGMAPQQDNPGKWIKASAMASKFCAAAAARSHAAIKVDDDDDS